MKWFFLSLDLLGFVVLCTLAVLVSSLSSVAHWLLVQLLCLIASFYQTITRLMKETITTATKNETRWIVIRLGKFSILLGRKNESRPNTEPARQNHWTTRKSSNRTWRRSINWIPQAISTRRKNNPYQLRRNTVLAPLPSSKTGCERSECDLETQWADDCARSRSGGGNKRSLL